MKLSGLLYDIQLETAVKDPAANGRASNLKRPKRWGLTLAAVAKCLQAVTWLGARGNKCRLRFTDAWCSMTCGVGDLIRTQGSSSVPEVPAEFWLPHF